jgi:hypothetical protein
MSGESAGERQFSVPRSGDPEKQSAFLTSAIPAASMSARPVATGDLQTDRRSPGRQRYRFVDSPRT